MVENGHKQALADAIAEARSEELARLAADLGNVGQLDLFGAVQSTQVPVVNGGPRGPGRPVGARNKRTDEAARFYMSRKWRRKWCGSCRRSSRWGSCMVTRRLGLGRVISRGSCMSFVRYWQHGRKTSAARSGCVAVWQQVCI
jgi:hypothetical protein